jgi:hypothetical protein
MKKIALLVVVAAGCSDEADIGVDSKPVTCAQVGGAEVNGTIHRDATTDSPARDIEFGATTPRVSIATGGTTVSLTASEVSLSIAFRCGDAELASYDVVEQTRDQLPCPGIVTGFVSGQFIQAIAKDGKVIVDETSNCLADRFAVDLSEGSELDGWFSAAWQ